MRLSNGRQMANVTSACILLALSFQEPHRGTFISKRVGRRSNKTTQICSEWWLLQSPSSSKEDANEFEPIWWPTTTNLSAKRGASDLLLVYILRHKATMRLYCSFLVSRLIACQSRSKVCPSDSSQI